jgi:hypothetical protein
VPEIEDRRKKPLPIRMLLWDGSNFAQVDEFTGSDSNASREGGELEVWNDQENNWMTVPLGHYVVHSTLGEYYPMSAAAREATTEPAGAVSLHARTLYAAWIDISRADRDAAVRLIRSAQPGQWDGPPWNGFETGETYLARTENPATGDGRDETAAEPRRM